MSKDCEHTEMLFKEMADFDIKKLKKCRTCIHRKSNIDNILKKKLKIK